MVEQKARYRAFQGKTYTLFGNNSGTEEYYSTIKDLADLFLEKCPDEGRLFSQLQEANSNSFFLRKLSRRNIDPSFISFIRKTLGDSLSVYTRNVNQHLKDLPLTRRFKECFINLGSLLLKKYNIRPYISVTMEQERLFKKLKAEHPGIGALGIACIPELIRGMRLCIQLNIPPVGIPLDANRCARWMKQANESSFNLEELEELLR